MKWRILIYLLAVLSVASCLNAEEAAIKDLVLTPPDIRSCNAEVAKASLTVSFKAELTRQAKLVDAGFYIARSSSFTEEDKHSVVSSNDAISSLNTSCDFMDYGGTYYYAAYINNGKNEILSKASTFKIGEFEEFVEISNPIWSETAAHQIDISFVVASAEDVALDECGIFIGNTPESLSLSEPIKSSTFTNGVHVVGVNNLVYGNTYYVLAYAKEKSHIICSDTLSFEYLDLPIVETSEPDAVSFYTASCGGSIIDTKGSPITDKGIILSYSSKSGEETTQTYSSGSGSEAFIVSISNLTPGTSYTVRAYATNKLGTGYGTQKLFTTLIPVDSVVLDKGSLAMEKNTTHTLIATVLPSNASEKGVIWSSDNEAIATVTNGGTITAKAVGKATITVTTVEGSKIATCSVSVTQKPTGVKVTSEVDTLIKGQSIALGVQVLPEDASQTVTWSSSDKSVAVVSSSGVVTAKANGNVKITATAINGIADMCSLVVVTPVIGVNLSANSITIGKGESYTLTATVLPKDASDKRVRWESLDNSIATVSNGVVTGMGIGKDTIIVYSVDGDIYDKCIVSVIEIMETNLSETGTANCYIVNKSGYFSFKGNVKGGSFESVGNPASAEVLWESFGTNVAPSIGDIVKKVSYSNGFVHFSTPTTLQNGNAVIAVKDASGTILWSWHIWVCKDFNPNETAQVYNNDAGTMMDRNLGATSATKGDVHAIGLLYQWGRKDPFLGSSSTSASKMAVSTLSWPNDVTASAEYGTVAYAVAHPTTFISSASGNDDWLASSETNRWQSTKTIYDPCPNGWRVSDGGSDGIWAKAFGYKPTWYTSSNWDATNLGMDFGKTDRQLGVGVIWYPATGYCTSGTNITAVDYYCGYWTCNALSTSSYSFYFNSPNFNCGIHPTGTTSRYYGQAVRCVKDGKSTLEQISEEDLKK